MASDSDMGDDMGDVEDEVANVTSGVMEEVASARSLTLREEFVQRQVADGHFRPNVFA